MLRFFLKRRLQSPHGVLVYKGYENLKVVSEPPVLVLADKAMLVIVG